jgi:hypothetical protein
MAKVTGGLHGVPAGNVGGVVYGAARDRLGKIVTARQKVIPANPQSTDQTIQRNKFSDALEIVRSIGPGTYQDEWNRTIGQLPGFQSLMSIFLDAQDAAGTLTAPPETPMGTLDIPVDIAGAAGALAGEVDVTWTDDTGANAGATDKLHVISIEADRPVGVARIQYNVIAAAVRSAATYTQSGLGSGNDILMAWYFEGQAAFEGLWSNVVWAVVTAKA